MTSLKLAAILLAAAMMAAAAWRRREWRGGLLFVTCIFLAGAAQECEEALEPLFPGFREPETPVTVAFIALGCAFAWAYRGSTRIALAAIWRNRRLPLLVWGGLFISLFPNVAKAKFVWAALAPPDVGTHAVREAAESAAETLGCVLLLNWAVLFLKDKWAALTRRTPSPHEHLIAENELVEVGRGSRRVCYRIGETGFCAKFYIPPEECVPGRMKKSVRRDIAWRRFNKWRNSCSQEIYFRQRFGASMPEEIREAMPEVMERVFHPKWGWGVLETLYVNPDGRTIIPAEWEADLKRDPAFSREVYRRIKRMLGLLIGCSAHFYEASNFFAWLQPDGSFRLKIIDFEPESKTLIPLEYFWPWFRRRKLRKDARRYLAHLREKFALEGEP